MPVFDTPINTDDSSLTRVLKQSLPVLLYLHDKPNLHLDSALKLQAEKHAGQLLIIRVEASESPQTYSQYGSPKLPAIVALQNEEVKASAEGVQSSDVVAKHINYLLGVGPKPEAQQKPAEKHVKPAAVTDATFQQEVLQSDLPVLVDFWAPWCQPCHMIAPTVEEMAKQYAGRIKVLKLNVDENPNTAAMFNTRSIPTLIMFRQGQVVDRVVGVQPPQMIDRLVQSAL